MIDKVNIPAGKSGVWEIKKFTVSQEQSHATFFQYRGRMVPAGEYTKLTENGHVIMSDTPAEMQDHRRFVREANGRILVAGLGIGMVAKALANKENVTEVIVVELSEDVIKLVAEHLQDDKIKVIQSNIHDYKPNEKFDFAWFDIWPDITTDNLPEMKTLQMKFRKWVKKSDCWGKSISLGMKKQEDEENYYMKLFRPKVGTDFKIS